MIAVSGKAVSGSLAGLPLLSVVSFGFSPPAVSGTLAVLNGDCKAPAEVLSWRRAEALPKADDNMGKSPASPGDCESQVFSLQNPVRHEIAAYCPGG